ncbi:MAG: SH3 domain-containing protein [Saprospiraceae bacterium]|nr:SH3 domain-containing protein [Saprospiraceae bacterium]
MKKFIFSAILSIGFLLINAQEDPYKATGTLLFHEYVEAKEAFVLVSDANLRDKPSTKATVVAQLPIATKVQILERTTDSLTLNGFRAPWFKVEANGKVGYLWSGILTTVAIASQEQSTDGIMFLGGISSYNEKDYKLTLQVRAAKDGKELAKLEFPSVADLGYEMSISLKGGIFENVKQVLSVEATFGACDYAQGDYLVFFTEGGKLVKQLETISSSSAGAGYASETYLLPSDKGGITGHVLVTDDMAATEEVTKKNGEVDFKVKDQKLKITLHRWTGAKLEKVFSR